ncbi:MAG: hypothetical protein QM658_04575 [Gordonia sp. (in: high G+C Gram-positive bacteria)]
MSRYDRVRFIGYAVPTTPADIVAVGDPNGTGALAGTYRAADRLALDIEIRARQLKVAVDTARDAVRGGGDGVLNVFVAPEFYWHGQMGPYVHDPGERDPGEVILSKLAELFPATEYPDFLFVLGTGITTKIRDLSVVMNASTTTVRNDVVKALGSAWLRSEGPLATVVFDSLVDFIKNAHAYPEVEVRNRAFVLGPGEFGGLNGELGATALTTEKYFDSNEDFLLWDVTGRPVITEQMCAYPVLDLSGGDAKNSAFDPHSLFCLPGEAAERYVAGVEICLDHADQRMRKSVHRTTWPADASGLDLHLLPSCGMQLHPSSVAARAGGWAFNCDGQYVLDGTGPGAGRRSVVGGVPSVHADYVHSVGSVYGAHTQLARVASGPEGEGTRVPGGRDAVFGPPPEIDVVVIEVPPIDDFDVCFAGGPGAVHLYGSDSPLPLRGDVSPFAGM